MGAGTIIENHIANTCSSIWQKAPNIPELTTVDLSKYNKSFVNLVSVIGAYALIKSTIWGTRKLLHYAKPALTLPTAAQMQNRYGSHSWALIVDCK